MTEYVGKVDCRTASTVDAHGSGGSWSTPLLGNGGFALREARGVSRTLLSQYRVWRVGGHLAVSSLAALVSTVLRFGHGEVRPVRPVLLVACAAALFSCLEDLQLASALVLRAVAAVVVAGVIVHMHVRRHHLGRRDSVGKP